MIRIEHRPDGRVRVAGHLQEPALKLLADAISRGPVVLDLSEVDRADESAVWLLAALPPGRCRLTSCPKWLSLWLEQVRQVDGDMKTRGRPA